MCGIAGFVSFDRTPIEAGLLLRMGNKISHRGPDDEGYVLIQQRTGQYAVYSGPDSPSDIQERYPRIAERQHQFAHNIGLAHRRFAIIDLSSRGHQPFCDAANTCCLVFNGEIYNYIEVREELQGLGHHFRSASDTEVICEAYKAWGTDCFRRFNGMWALALYDFDRGILIASRDRLGKTPLYWSKKSNGLYFASEIKALFEVQEIAKAKAVNEPALYPWIVSCLRDLDNSTFFRDIYTLPAGSWAVFNEAFPDGVRRYWQVPAARLRERDISVGEAVTAIRETLGDAVRIRMHADVPWCVELSGGMDSSVLTAYAAQQIAGQKLVTYTVRFAEKEWDESAFALSVARRFATEHHVIDSPLENFWPEILPFTQLEEEPYHSPNLHTNQVIRRMMRADGIKMLLNGAAGDELFAGYNYYFNQVQIENLLGGRIGRYVDNGLHHSESTNAVGALLSPVISMVKYGAKAMLSSVGLKRERHPYIKTARLLPESQPITATEALYTDITNGIIPYYLRSGDKTHMGLPIEGRCPFLDYRMVELAFSLPVTYLIRDGWHKWILRKALEDLLPYEVVWRKNKMGFPFPYERFFFDSKEILECIFREANNPFIDLSMPSNLYFDPYQYWRLISFVLWYELFFNTNIGLFERIGRLAEKSTSPTDYGFLPEFLKTCQVFPK